MYRLVKMSDKWYGVEVSDLYSLTDDELEDISIFVGEGTPVMLVDDLSDLENIGLSADDIEVVE